MMKPRQCALFFWLLCLGVFQVASAKNVMQDLDQQIGWVENNCLAIQNANIPLHTVFRLVSLDGRPFIEKATIVKKADDGQQCAPAKEGRKESHGEGSPYSFYLIKSTKKITTGVGVLNGVDLSNMRFSFCLSSEGVHYRAIKKQTIVWRAYNYLGYDVEATCKDAQ